MFPFIIGDGHFSPVAGYHKDRDLLLVLDVARFKYPPYWVHTKDLWDAMAITDGTTGKSRGYFTISAWDIEKTSSSPQQSDSVIESVESSVIGQDCPPVIRSWTSLTKDTQSSIHHHNHHHHHHGNCSHDH
jgi:hypothetical protein